MSEQQDPVQVANAVQQQQDAASVPVPAAPQQTPQSTTIDSLTCQWSSCGERCSTPEALYDHVCERHVGRKSTNNLNLTCQWGACRTTTVKRDHITSHIRVHVPLKPHKCDFCGKAFKRPQDLKKHVKTHADDSVLLRSPEPNMRGANAQPNGYQQPPTSKAGYYGGAHDMGYPSHHSNPLTAGNGGYYNNNNSQYSGYGQVNYPQSNTLSDISSLDTRKRAIEALNDFLGDVKRRALNPASYYDVGQRLQSNSLPLPVSTGFGYSTGNSYSNSNSYGGAHDNIMDAFGGSSMGGGGGIHGPLSQNYSLPLSNARTKNDLIDIDRFLEQLSQTVYESSNSAAAAGIQQPGAHTQYTGSGYAGMHNQSYRHSDSPPQLQHQGSSMASGIGSLSSVPNLNHMTSSASAIDTPALTPSSVSSYASSSHSPMSSHSRTSMGGISGGSMYPTLPPVSGGSDIGYPPTSSAPPSGLASGFEGFEGRRYSGGRLQREAPERETLDMDVDDDGSRTPRASEVKKEAARPSSSSLDPALRSAADVHSPETSTPSSTEDKQQEAWVENIRVIEQLRKYIQGRLETRQYEDEDGLLQPEDQQQPEQQHQHDPQLQAEYALERQLREAAHQEANEHRVHHEQPMHPDQSAEAGAEKPEGISYPVLKTEA